MHTPANTRACRHPVRNLAVFVVFTSILGGAAMFVARAAADPPGAASASAQPQSGPSEKINVIIYLVDTLRADRLGAYGYQQAVTPKIDELAAEGVVFEQACSQAPWTLPSVVSLMTSRFMCEHGIVGMQNTPAGKVCPQISAQHKTLAQRLEPTHANGALYCNVWAGLGGLDRGYEFFRDVNVVQGPITDFWIGGIRGRPVDLYIHTMEPHDPWRVYKPNPAPLIKNNPRFAVPANIVNQFEQLYFKYLGETRAAFDKGVPLGAIDNTAEQQASMAALQALQPHVSTMYDAAVAFADQNLGSVIAGLKKPDKRSGKVAWDNTLFIFTADHGEELGDRGGWLHDHSVYEELIRVPLIIKFPAGRFAGTRVADPVRLIDVMPTIFDVLGKTDLCSDCRGESLVPFADGKKKRDPAEKVVVSMRNNQTKFFKPYKEQRGDLNVVVRQGSWKAIWNVEPDTVELYDLAADPGEKKNLADAQAAQAADLKAFASQWLDQCKAAAPAPGQQEVDPEDIKRLGALGYAGDQEPTRPATQPSRQR